MRPRGGRVDPSFTLTGVESSDVLAFVLERGVPNPVRDAAMIRYALDEVGDVLLVLYDVLGREVAVLDEGQRSAGAHTVLLDASSLAPGVYVYRLTAGGRTLTQMLTVTR